MSVGVKTILVKDMLATIPNVVTAVTVDTIKSNAHLTGTGKSTVVM